MSFLTIGATAIKVTNFRRVEDERAGGLTRTVNGELRGDALWTKRQWQGVAYAESPAAADAIRALAPYGTAVTVSGDAMRGASVTAMIEFGDSEYTEATGSWYEMIAFTIREV